jgi:hypothetical protein
VIVEEDEPEEEEEENPSVLDAQNRNSQCGSREVRLFSMFHVKGNIHFKKITGLVIKSLIST